MTWVSAWLTSLVTGRCDGRTRKVTTRSCADACRLISATRVRSDQLASSSRKATVILVTPLDVWYPRGAMATGTVDE